ncbi:hypothetical protein MP638_006436 [Amoeboaphelidium occidentale]|nr:hypothetical protein MP638_006436 [Amoeboaphelidium occidentale]
MLEYLGDKLFTTENEYNIFGSVAGWDYRIKNSKTLLNATIAKGLSSIQRFVQVFLCGQTLNQTMNQH